VALDRQSIEKKDFPIGRRGYDPEAVDAHLTALANEVEELGHASRRRTESLATTASEQVRAIIAAAEATAAELGRQAEEEAQEIRAEASGEAHSTREQAAAQARDYLGRISGSMSEVVQRVEAMQSELSSLFESLRTGGSRVTADLQLLEGNLDAIKEAIAPRQQFDPESRGAVEPLTPEQPVAEAAAEVAREPEPAAEVVAEPEHVAEVATKPQPGPEVPTQREPAAEVAQPEPAEAAAQASNGSEDLEGARLIALNMALNGTPREETDRYLAENFRLADRRALLDDVYSSVEG
jgi:DivIVA domain-containing protein